MIMDFSVFSQWVKNNDQAEISAALGAVHLQDEKDYAMYIAAISNNCAVLKMVLNVGAGSIENRTLRETIERAAELGFYDCVQILIPLCGQKSIGRALNGAAYNGYADILTLLLPFSSVELNSEALTCAAYKGQRECLEILIPVSDPTHEDSEALRLAVRGHVPVGANIPLTGHSTECVKLLLAVSDPTAQNSGALQLAVTHKLYECMELLSPVSDVFAAFEELRLSSHYENEIKQGEQYIHQYLSAKQKDILHNEIGETQTIVQKRKIL